MPHFIKWFYFFQISSFFFHHHFVRVQGGDFNFFLLSAHFTRLLLPFSFFFFPSVLSSNPHTTFFVPPLFKTPNNYHLVFLRKISATFSKRKFPFTRVEQKSIFLPDLWSTWTNIVFFFSFFRGCFFFWSVCDTSFYFFHIFFFRAWSLTLHNPISSWHDKSKTKSIISLCLLLTYRTSNLSFSAFCLHSAHAHIRRLRDPSVML